MRVQGVRPGDIVECDRNGVHFLATVTGKAAGVLDVVPVDRRFTWRSVKPRQVRKHWRLAR